MRGRWARGAKVRNSGNVTCPRSGGWCAFKIIPRTGEASVLLTSQIRVTFCDIFHSRDSSDGRIVVYRRVTSRFLWNRIKIVKYFQSEIE